MDESASDLSMGIIALSNVAEQAGVNKFTGILLYYFICVRERVYYQKPLKAAGFRVSVLNPVADLHQNPVLISAASHWVMDRVYWVKQP